MHLLPFRYLRCALKARKPHPPTLSHTRTKWPLYALFVLVAGGLVSSSGEPITGMIRQNMDEDGSPRPFALTLKARDNDGDAIEWSIAEQGAHGKASISGNGAKRRIHYVPDADWNGVDRFFIRISDGLGGSNTIAVEVTVEPRNDPPHNKTAPRLLGRPDVGENLTVDVGEWDDSRDGRENHLAFRYRCVEGRFTFHYQWQISGSLNNADAIDVPGATGTSFRIREEHDGMYVRAVVTATERGEDGLSTVVASNFYRVGNTAPVFVQVAPAPPKQAEPKVTVKQIVLAGNDSIPTHELEPILAGYVGLPVTLSELKAAADAVTAAYRRRGMTLAKAYLPAQDITDGRVELTILEGKPGTLTVEGNQRFSEEFVRGHIEAAMSTGPVSNRELERGLLIMNEDYPGLDVQTVLTPGQKRGEVNLKARVRENKRWHGSVGYNNLGSDFVGRHRFSAAGDISGVAFEGDMLKVRGTVGEEPHDLVSGALEYRAPLNYHGTQLGLRLSGGGFDVSEEFADLGMKGKNVSAGLYVSHPFIKQRELRLTGEVGLQSEDAKFLILDEASSIDRVRALYASLRGSHEHWGGSTTAIANVTQGLGAFASGVSEDPTVASRPGGDSQFTRLTLSLARQQQLSRYAGLLLRLDGQLATDALTASQEWQVGGIDSVRGYNPGEVAGDEGFSASLELQIRPQPSKPYSVVAFIDHGYARRRETFVSESRDKDLTGAGLGIRLSHRHESVTGTLRLDVGWPVGSEDNTVDDEPVLYLSTELRF